MMSRPLERNRGPKARSLRWLAENPDHFIKPTKISDLPKPFDPVDWLQGRLDAYQPYLGDTHRRHFEAIIKEVRAGRRKLAAIADYVVTDSDSHLRL